ncbi:hypothetical protein SF83666_c39530 [Sinorhizobium fredii CCBAU 83666]|nr:hypothetical protein SF83666_c39530 [Sinorhizobium fredii CCBAU 83666]
MYPPTGGFHFRLSRRRHGLQAAHQLQAMLANAFFKTKKVGAAVLFRLAG